VNPDVVPAARTKADAEQVLSRAGLGIASGRTIPGLGLSNLVVPLKRGRLLEILYPNGEQPAPGAPPLLQFNSEALAAHPSAPMVPMAWLMLMEDERRLRELAAADDLSVQEVPAEGPATRPARWPASARTSTVDGCPASSTGRKVRLRSMPNIGAGPLASPGSTWPARPTTYKM
jgi:hypothetical protein